MASIKNTGVAARTNQQQQQGQQGGEGQTPYPPQPQAPAQLTVTGKKNSRVQISRNAAPPQPQSPKLNKLSDFQTKTSEIDPRKILQRPSTNQALQDQVFASVNDVVQGTANWADMYDADRKNILSDPNFYKENKITGYTPAQQQQILADPNFDWKQLPKWQQLYYSASSNPAAMGAVQGLVMGAGNPGGAILGGTLGWASSVLGYDPNKEFWQQGDGKFTFDTNQAADAARGAFGLLNWGAEQAEKGIGTVAQVANYAADPNKQVADLFKNFDATWNAGGNFFEAITPAINEAFSAKNKAQEGVLRPIYEQILPIYLTAKIGEIILNPEKYKGNEIYLGANSPIPLDKSWIQRIDQAREEIKTGRNYREVMNEMQNGIMAQIGDMAGQGIADPLNFVGKAEAKAGEVTARITGDKIAETAFSQSEGFFDAQARIRNLVNNPSEAIKIDPNYKVTELGWVTKQLANLTPEGKVKGGLLPSSGALLDYKPSKNIVTRFVDSLTSLTPESRARVGQDLLVRNLGSIMASYFNGTDVAGFSKWWKGFTNGDMTQSAELSKAMANSPEFYTVLPAAKEFDISGQLGAWEQTEPARMTVSQIADVLGENPVSWIEDTAKRGTIAEDFTRLQETLTKTDTPEAKALLGEIEAGRLTADTLTEAVKIFSDGNVAFHPGQWMAQTLDMVKEHYDNWAVDHFKLDEESKKTLFRVTAVMKSAQSILLLGANPGYFISNVLPTMVTRAASGVYGYMTPTAIDSFFGRMGFSLEEGFAPSRLEEGVGPGGLIDQTRQTGDAIREATLGKGKLTDIQRALGKIGSAMPFNKLSRLLEGYESKMAYAVGIKKFWGESWRRGTGFRDIPQGLLTELTRTAGPRASEILLSAIESGMTKDEINAIVTGRSRDIQTRSLINQAAQDLNIPANKAASMLEQMGILDGLDASLKGANTESRVRAAFDRAQRTAQEGIDRQASADAIARIEHVSNRIQTEGVKAVTDIVLDTEMKGIEKWLQHYERMGEVADIVDSIPDAETRSRLWGLKYAESNAEYRRHAAERGSTYLGILKAIGLDTSEAGKGWLATIANTDATLDNAYRTMRQLRDEHFKKWNNEWDNPRRGVERGQIEATIDKVWKDATKTEVKNLANMGELLGQQYEQLFSVEAGEAARQAWAQITDFRKEMVQRRDDFRKSLEGVPAAQRQVMSKEFWQNNYNFMVVEMGKIKQDAIAELDRIANNPGGTTTAPGIPPRPDSGGGAPSPEMQALRQQAEERARIQKEKESAIWDIAEQYSKMQPGNSSNFNRGYFLDNQHLMGALKKEEYGGDPSVKNIQEAAQRFTPEEVQAIFEKRNEIKTAEKAQEEAARAQKFEQVTQDAAAKASNRKAAENVTILQNIRKRGGIDFDSWVRFADKPEGYQVGVFSKTGKNRWSLDQMARLLADDGYPIDINDPADIGGVNQLVDLITRARAGDEIFPVGHEFIIDAAVNKAQAEYIDSLVKQTEFDPDQWLTDMIDAAETKNRAAMDTLIENLPAEYADQPYNVTGETYSDYIKSQTEELDATLQRDEQDTAIAQNQVRAEQAVQQQETVARTSMTRQMFRDSLTDVFNLSDTEAEAVMDITDARANAYGNADEWYSTRIADVQKAGGIDFAQEAYHGSPHRFDKFTLDHMGTGEGVQAYGWGLYFAGDKAVAEWYHRKLSDRQVTYDGKVIKDFRNSDHLTIMVDMFKYLAEGHNVENAKELAKRPYQSEYDYYASRFSEMGEVPTEKISELPDTLHLNIDRNSNRPYSVIPEERNYAKPWNGSYETPEAAIANAIEFYNEGVEATQSYKERLDAIDNLNNSAFKVGNTGQLYKVEIPDNNYLLWDKPLSEQPENIKNALAQFIPEIDAANYEKDYYLSQLPDELKPIAEKMINDPANLTNGTYDAEWQRLTKEAPNIDHNIIHDINDSLNRVGYGQDIYERINNDPKAASLALKDAGINGIQFLDGNSRGKGEGNYNYVIFDDNAIQVKETFYQSGATGAPTDAPRGTPKGGVQFLDDGRAIIRAFQKADVSTVVHEIGHIFRRDLQGKDLRLIETWAEVKNGEWTRAAEEKFARGFEKYLADGSAPTPKLRGVFEKFKSWMGSIYRAITGSPIDVELTPKVKEVFDRLLLGNDPLINRAHETDAQVIGQAGTEIINSFQAKLDAIKKRNASPRTLQQVDTSVDAPRKGTEVWKMTESEYNAMLLQEQRDFANRRLKSLENEPRDTWGWDQRQFDKETQRMQALLARDTLSWEMFGDARDKYRAAIEQALKDDQPVPESVRQNYYTMGKEGNLSAAEYKNLQQAGRGQVDTLFQMAAPTDTPEFRNWFGESKVVDESGQPLVVYHGTNGDVTSFEIGRRGAIYLAADPKHAAQNANPYYVNGSDDPQYLSGANIMPLYLKLENPYAHKVDGIVDPSIEDAVIKKAKDKGHDGIVFTDMYGREYYAVFSPKQIKSVANQGTFDPSNPNILFQEADPRMPLGGYEEAADWLPQSEVMDEGWSSEVQPLLDKMKEAAVRSLNEPTMDGAYKDMTPEGQAMLRQYLNGVQQDMASTKMAAQRWGAEKRDNAMLNYNKRYGFDKMLDVVFPYQFFYTRSMMTWAMRALDKPAWLSNYARLRRQQDRYENNLPERLRGKMRIDAPWLPDWMGDGLYIDPLSVLFTPHNFLRPMEQLVKDKNMQTIEAERILQEWAADGTVPQDQIVQAAQQRSGSTWERAIAEAKIRREAEISNPMDFVSMMFGPAWYLTTPAKLLNIGKDGPQTIGELPITRTARAIDTVTNNTWAEPIGNVLGLLAKPEEAFREKNNLPQFGEYGDYYTDRQIANMVAEGLITSEQAQIAMIERKGDIFTQAQERVKMELAMRVPLSGFIYAGLNEGVKAAAQAAAPSLFGASLLPEGELKFRGLKDEWNQAWKLRDAGDTEAINRFFTDHPEYEAYLAKGKQPEERLRSFLIGQIWDGYMELGDTNRKQATAEMGDLFKQAFINPETRSYDTLDIETLTQWAQMLTKQVPNVPQTAPAILAPRKINYFTPEVTDVTDTFFQQRKRMYGDYYELEQGYYDLPKSERASYLIANPKLKQYWDWKDGWYNRYPELQPVFRGQVFKRVDTSTWPIGLEDYVTAYAYGGEQLPKGAYKALQQVWINEGRPMDDFDTWLKSNVVPAIMYKQQGQ